MQLLFSISDILNEKISIREYESMNFKMEYLVCLKSFWMNTHHSFIGKNKGL